MKIFEILSIILENIKSYTYEEISFLRGNNVLIGENGAGKSTILESIYLALFGETVPDRLLVDMIRTGEKQGKITIRFKVDEINYRIEDEIIRRDETHATQSQVLINETLEETVAEGKNAVKAKMEEILTIDATTFSNAVYASQGELDKIVTAKKNERKKLFDRLFQLERFEKAWNNLAKVERIINGTITNLETKYNLLTKDINELPKLKEKLVGIKEQLKKTRSSLEGLKAEFAKNNERYTILEKVMRKYERLSGEKDALQKSIEDLEEEVKDNCLKIQAKIKDEKIDCELEAIKKLAQKYLAESKRLETSILNLKEKESAIKSRLDYLTQLKTETHSLKIDIETGLEELESEISTYQKKIPGLPKDLTLWEEKLNTILEETKKHLTALKKKEKQLQIKKEKYEQLQYKYTSLEDNKYDIGAKIVQKRLVLVRDVGDNWTEVLKNLASIDFDKQLEELNSKQTVLEEEKEKAMVEKAAIINQLAKIKNDLQHLTELKGKETCPMCKQSLSKETLEKLRLTLLTEKKQLSEREKELKAQIKDLSQELEEITRLEKQLSKQSKLHLRTKEVFESLKELEENGNKIESALQKTKLQLEKLAAKKPAEVLDDVREKIADKEYYKTTIQDIIKVIPRLASKNDYINKKKSLWKKKKGELTELIPKVDETKLVAVGKEISENLEEKKLIDDLLKELHNQVLKLSELNKKKENLLECQKKIAKLTSTEGFDVWEEIKERQQNLASEIAGKKATINSLKNDVLPPLKGQIKDLEEKKQKAQQIEKSLELERKKKEITKILRGIMRELPNRLLPTFIQRINKTSTEILQSIIPGSDIQNIVLEDDYSLKIIRLGNSENVSVLSGGETVIIALALRLAFAKEFSTLDVLILDEPTIFLDERRRSELISVLERTRLVQQMFVVTHDPDFERISDKIFYVAKEYGEAKVKSLGDQEELGLGEVLPL